MGLGQMTRVMPDTPHPQGHGLSIHHIGRPKAPGQMTQTLPDPSLLGLMDLALTAQVGPKTRAK